MSWIVLFVLAAHAGHIVILVANLLYLRGTRPTRSGETKGRLSVLIPARNEAANLSALIPALLAQDHPDLEIVVVNDGSEDGSDAVLAGFRDDRLSVIRLDGPPVGWLGKPFALHTAALRATGDRFLFLDADVLPVGSDAIGRLDTFYGSLPGKSVMTGLPRLSGGGMLLVSQVAGAILTGLPWPLVRRMKARSLAALNGQCWMIDAASYRLERPHELYRNEILEDVRIGRHLKSQGYVPVLADLRSTLRVSMYDDLAGAWMGFRKNAYLIMGGSPLLFVPLWLYFLAVFVVAPLVWPLFLVPVYLTKACVDRFSGVPWRYTVVAPLSYLLAALIQADSFFHHLTGHVAWKGRQVLD